jgi:two-component system sensor histidine kinase DesK
VVDCAVETPPLAPAQEVVLALAVREAVTNVIRHARAKRCTIRLARAGEVCRLTVADDGRGGMAGDGFGLAGMRERVASLGGTFLHDYSHGTTLTIELPLLPVSLLTMEQRA